MSQKRTITVTFVQLTESACFCFWTRLRIRPNWNGSAASATEFSVFGGLSCTGKLWPRVEHTAKDTAKDTGRQLQHQNFHIGGRHDAE